MRMDSIVSVVNVNKQYGEKKVLDNISIDVPVGSIYGLLGPNGAGKTTLIRIINGITAADNGDVYFKGRLQRKEDSSLIGYLPEERGLYRKMKVGEQVLYLALLKGLEKKEAQNQVNHWFEKFEIESWRNRKVEELSKGMQQKVQFIATVLHKPSLLILDEPFSGFDPINSEMLKNELFNLREQGATIVLSTHNMASVEEMCDHISLINKSKCILQGEVQQIQQSFKSGEYELCFTGDAQSLISLLKDEDCIITKQKQQKYNYVMNIKSSKEGNYLLAKAIPLINVVSFKETLPGMNDIFKQLVSN